MNYLYGDSTPSQLKSNFLEFLRDALDFCVFVLQADAKMKEGRVQIRVFGEEAEAEQARLERFIHGVQATVKTADKGAIDSPTARTGERLTQQIADTHRQSVDGIKRMLADAIARIEAEENAARDACVNALALLIAPHDPPDTAAVTRLGLLESGQYDATLDGKAEPALEWTLELGIPDTHAWAAPMRVERLVPHLEIRAPQLAGWITKEVKVKPLRIERYVVTEIVESGESTLTFELRTEPTSEVGFDFLVDFSIDKIGATRVGPADDGSVGGFDLTDEDAAQIKDLALKLKESLVGLERIPNIVSTFEGADFRTLPEYIEIVDRLVAMMKPIVLEISARSLTPNELIIRRLLGNDRREEIFVAKSTLREKLNVLPTTARALFDSLQLDPALPAAPAPVAAKKPEPAPPPVVVAKEKQPSEKPPVRSELPPSMPPPATRTVAPVVRIPAPPAPRRMSPSIPDIEGGMTAPTVAATRKMSPSIPDIEPPPAVVKEKEKSSPPAANAQPKSAPPPQSTPSGTMPAIRTLQPPGSLGVPPPASPPNMTEKAPDSDDSPSLEVGPEVELPPETLFTDLPPKPESSAPIGGSRNETLVSALKKIMTLSKNGRGSEAYQEYTELFASDEFGELKPEDQRQALKLMVLAKTHVGDPDAVTEAHKAALPRIERLLENGNKEAADYELLGVTQLHLGEPQAAATAFQSGLEIERSKNPQSELIASLMRRVSQL